MAANGDRLKSMIMSFRVAELQCLLEYAGEKNLRLRKKELQKKALKLIAKKRLAKKVKSIYKSMMGSSSDDDDEQYMLPDLKDCFDECFFDENEFPPYETYLSNCSNSFSDTSYYAQTRSEDQYFAMFTKNLDMKRLNSIQFRSITFYEYLNDILSITPLIPKKQEEEFFLFQKTFLLNSETIRSIFSDGSRCQALLRFCVLNNETEVSDQLPPVLCVKVNHEVCPLPTISSASNKQGVSRRSPPIDITLYLEKKSKYGNTLSIEWSVDYCTLYGIVIQLMKKHTSEELITKLKERGERDAEISKKFIYDSLNDDDDNEISATTLKMSLICPIGKMAITLPTRATTCNHLQCFDGCSYIQINELKSTWICPVCSQSCLYENLFIDGYFTEILRSDKFLPGTRDVELDPDGSWRPVMQQQKKERSCKKLEIVPDDIVVEPKLKSYVESKSTIESDNIIDNLKDFLYRYTVPDHARSNMSSEERLGLNVNQPSLPIPSENDSVPLEPKLQNELSANSIDENLPKKKDILLVDLTMSDSESDDVKSLSSDSYVSWSPTVNPFPNFDLNTRSPVSPPVYDIDSDSDSSF